MLTSTKILLAFLAVVLLHIIAWAGNRAQGKEYWKEALISIVVVLFLFISVFLPGYQKAVQTEEVRAWNRAHPHSKPRHYE